MCDASGFKLSSSRIEDKFEYKKIVNGGKKLVWTTV